MSEQKPQKRLVSKRQYVYLWGKKVGLYSCGGLTCFLGALGYGCAVFALTRGSNHGDIYTGIPHYVLVPAFLLIPVFIVLVLLSKLLIKKAKAIEPTQPLTNNNAHLLPAPETLLRGSEHPPTVAQAELLRATQAGPETPHEELLRVTDGKE